MKNLIRICLTTLLMTFLTSLNLISQFQFNIVNPTNSYEYLYNFKHQLTYEMNNAVCAIWNDGVYPLFRT